MRFAARSVSTVLLLNFSVLLSSAAQHGKSAILVAAAADLHPLQAILSKASPVPVEFIFGASGALVQQIRNGAPYDVYLSANERFVKELADSGLLLKDTVQVYAQGRLGLWSKSGRIRSLAGIQQRRNSGVCSSPSRHFPVRRRDRRQPEPGSRPEIHAVPGGERW